MTEGGIPVFEHMFLPHLPLLEKVLRALAIYIFLIGALRIVSKRELAGLSTIDLVVLLAIANAVQNGIQGEDLTVTGNVISAATLFAANSVVSRLLYHVPRFRRLIEGDRRVLVERGSILTENCHREEITPEELLLALQRQGADDMSEVEEAVIDPSGAIVITKRAPSPELRAIARLEEQIATLVAQSRAARRGPPEIRT